MITTLKLTLKTLNSVLLIPNFSKVGSNMIFHFLLWPYLKIIEVWILSLCLFNCRTQNCCHWNIFVKATAKILQKKVSEVAFFPRFTVKSPESYLARQEEERPSHAQFARLKNVIKLCLFFWLSGIPLVFFTELWENTDSSTSGNGKVCVMCISCDVMLS